MDFRLNHLWLKSWWTITHDNPWKWTLVFQESGCSTPGVSCSVASNRLPEVGSKSLEPHAPRAKLHVRKLFFLSVKWISILTKHIMYVIIRSFFSTEFVVSIYWFDLNMQAYAYGHTLESVHFRLSIAHHCIQVHHCTLPLSNPIPCVVPEVVSPAISRPSTDDAISYMPYVLGRGANSPDSPLGTANKLKDPNDSLSCQHLRPAKAALGWQGFCQHDQHFSLCSSILVYICSIPFCHSVCSDACSSWEVPLRLPELLLRHQNDIKISSLAQ